jgi:integrase
VRTTDVRFWEPRKHPGRKSDSYEVRWVVAGQVRSRSRRTKELAESFLSELRRAARRGDLFDIDTGLPESMLPAAPTITWLDFVQRYRRGGVIGKADSDAFGAARTLAFTPAQVLSPLADRPYALRHAALSLWLNAGVPAPEVAERAGHSVEVLLRVYAKCLDGGEATSNGRIADALSTV